MLEKLKILFTSLSVRQDFYRGLFNLKHLGYCNVLLS